MCVLLKNLPFPGESVVAKIEFSHDFRKKNIVASFGSLSPPLELSDL